jgi:hypothetical protein
LSSNKGRLPGTKAAMRASRSPSSRTFFIHAVDERNAESWMLEVVLQIARSAQSDLVKWYDVCALAARFPRSSISACFPLSICPFVFIYVGAGVVHNVPAGLMFPRVWCAAHVPAPCASAAYVPLVPRPCSSSCGAYVPARPRPCCTSPLLPLTVY